MKNIVMFVILALGILLFSACSIEQPVVTSNKEIENKPKIEIREKIVEKKVEVVKYVCADGKEVNDKTSCIDYIDLSWDLNENKLSLVEKLNGIKDMFGLQTVVEVTKLITNGDTVEISYTQINAEYQAKNVGQTMFDVLRETTKFLKENKNLGYNIKIAVLTSNGGYIFTKTTSKEDILKILNYELSEDEWIQGIIS